MKYFLVANTLRTVIKLPPVGIELTTDHRCFKESDGYTNVLIGTGAANPLAGGVPTNNFRPLRSATGVVVC